MNELKMKIFLAICLLVVIINESIQNTFKNKHKGKGGEHHSAATLKNLLTVASKKYSQQQKPI